MEEAASESRAPRWNALSCLWPALALLPALIPLVAIILYGVNMPFGDEWDLAGPLFFKLHTGTLTFADIVAQHNEHRVAITRLIILAFGEFTHYNVKAEMISTWGVAVAISVLVYRLGKRTLPPAADGLRLWGYAAWFVANLMIFHLIQCENWLWGMEVHFFLPTLCIISAALALMSGLPRWISIPIAILMSVISTYSAANGMILWLVMIPLVRYAGKPASLIVTDIWTACWVVCAGLTIWSYFRGYVKPPAHPSLLEALRHPGQFVLYFFVYLGSPLGPGTDVAPVLQSIAVGVFVAILFLAVLVYAWTRRKDDQLIKRALPWLTLGMYVLGTAFVTDLARLGFGYSEAIAPRYTSISVMIYVALIYLIPIFCSDARDFYSEGLRRACALAARPLPAVLAGALIALYIPSSAYGLTLCEQFKILRTNGQAALMFIDQFQDEALVFRTTGSVGQIPVVQHWAHYLNTLGYIHPPLVTSTDIVPLEGADQRGDDYYGHIDIVRPADIPGNWGIQGWALFPDTREPARAVLLTYQQGTGDPIVFGVGDAAQPRPDLVVQKGDPIYATAGFVKTFPVTLIPKGELKIQAWAFDLSTLKAYALSNPMTIHN